MDACRLRRKTGSLCHSFHGLPRVMADAAQRFQQHFGFLVLVLNMWLPKFKRLGSVSFFLYATPPL